MPAIDRDKLRTALRRLDDERVFYMLNDAIDLLPPARLAKLAGRYLDVSQLRPDAQGTKSLLAEARAFDASSRAGTYYQSFNVNSKNFMDKSAGTRAFIADCKRLLDRCVARASKGDAAETREAIELILGVLRHIDECHDDVVFFADEAGAWQVGATWARVFQRCFSVSARGTGPDGVRPSGGRGHRRLRRARCSRSSGCSPAPWNRRPAQRSAEPGRYSRFVLGDSPSGGSRSPRCIVRRGSHRWRGRPSASRAILAIQRVGP